MRVGFGYDVHVLGPGETFVLGGVRLDYELGTVAHSDGDVLAHSVIDALLGAVADGDIGARFPDAEDTWKGANSLVLLKEVAESLAESGYRIGNVDTTVALQKPRLRPHIDAMRANLAEAMSIDIGAVSVKATTTEGLGFEGRQEGITCYAVCLVHEEE